MVSSIIRLPYWISTIAEVSGAYSANMSFGLSAVISVSRLLMIVKVNASMRGKVHV